jgi:hypothetical protein
MIDRYHWKDLHWPVLEHHLELGSFIDTIQDFTKPLTGNSNEEPFKGKGKAVPLQA